MTADMALVVGTDGATREWAYTVMSRASLTTDDDEVFKRPERDPGRRALGRREPIRRGPDRPGVDPKRIKELALDYPERYEMRARISVESSLDAPATDGQQALLEMLVAPELAQDATRVEARDETERRVAERADSRVEQWLRETGLSAHAAHELVARAVDRMDAGFATGGPHNPSRAEPSAVRSLRTSTRNSKRRNWSSSASRDVTRSGAVVALAPGTSRPTRMAFSENDVTW